MRPSPSFLGVLLASASLAGAAVAQTWTGPDPSRRPSLNILSSDVDFAVSELCFPFLLQNASVETLTARRSGVVANPRPQPWADGKVFWVGGPHTEVELDHSGDGGRECTLRLQRGDPAKLKAALEARLAQLPAPLTRAGFQYPANNYAERILLCGPPAGPHDTALISVGGGAVRTVPLMATLRRDVSRSERCDGVPPPASVLKR